jgi:hypothetical protein
VNELALPVSDRTAFLIVFILGAALCSAGVGKAPLYGWLHPVTIVGYILGVAALALGVSVLFGVYVSPITTTRAALVALLGIMVAKVVVAQFYRLATPLAANIG